jgi:hypothetical protein
MLLYRKGNLGDIYQQVMIVIFICSFLADSLGFRYLKGLLLQEHMLIEGSLCQSLNLRGMIQFTGVMH